jgi:hypothetical protein
MISNPSRRIGLIVPEYARSQFNLPELPSIGVYVLFVPEEENPLSR